MQVINSIEYILIINSAVIINRVVLIDRMVLIASMVLIDRKVIAQLKLIKMRQHRASLAVCCSINSSAISNLKRLNLTACISVQRLLAQWQNN